MIETTAIAFVIGVVLGFLAGRIRQRRWRPPIDGEFQRLPSVPMGPSVPCDRWAYDEAGVLFKTESVTPTVEDDRRMVVDIPRGRRGGGIIQ